MLAAAASAGPDSDVVAKKLDVDIGFPEASKFQLGQGYRAGFVPRFSAADAQFNGDLYAARSNQLLGSFDAQGNFSQILTDAFGSVRDVIGPTGMLSHTDYDPFGNVLAGSAGVGLFGWHGMQYDAAAKLYRGSAARQYDPASGRWTSPDPAGFSRVDSNLYRYAGNGGQSAVVNVELPVFE